MARLGIIKLITALVAPQDWPMYQLDIKKTFLHKELSDIVYTEGVSHGMEAHAQVESPSMLPQIINGCMSV